MKRPASKEQRRPAVERAVRWRLNNPDRFKELKRARYKRDRLLCAPCNIRKNARDPIEFARSLGRLL